MEEKNPEIPSLKKFIYFVGIVIVLYGLLKCAVTTYWGIKEKYAHTPAVSTVVASPRK